jgi:hypothetical protein
MLETFKFNTVLILEESPIQATLCLFYDYFINRHCVWDSQHSDHATGWMVVMAEISSLYSGIQSRNVNVSKVTRDPSTYITFKL